MKKNVAIISVMVVCLLVLVVGICLLKKDKKEDKVKPPTSGDNKVTSELATISFNGLKLGDTPTEEMLNLVLDYDLMYEYKEVYFNVDNDNKIDELRFNTSTYTDGEVATGMDDVEIKYKDKVLKTEEDFKTYFGEGQVSKDEFNETILFEDKEVSLYVSVKDGAVISVHLKKNDSNRGDSKTISLANISFNGLKLGDTPTEEMLNLVLDYDLRYEYKNVYFDVDKDNKINELRFNTSTYANGEVATGMDDVEIKYKDKVLKTEKDFKDCFGEGQVSKEQESYTVLFEDKGVSLYVTIKNNQVINVRLKNA